jgi:hypothetical protein
MALNEMKIANVLRELNKLAPPLETKIKQTIQHAKALRSMESLDPRLLLNAATDLQKEAIQHDKELEHLTAEVQSLSRTGAAATMKGHLANIKGLRARLQKLLDELHAELQNLAKAANERLNEPGRWGDAATATGPVKDLMELIAMLIELLAKHRQKAR